MTKERKADVWLAYSSAAIAGLSQVLEEVGKKGEEDLMQPEQIAEIAADIADCMLDEYEERYGTKSEPAAKRVTRGRRRDDDEDDND